VPGEKVEELGGPHRVKWSLSCEVFKKDLVSDVLNIFFLWYQFGTTFI
jgi:hypothetical protein